MLKAIGAVASGAFLYVLTRKIEQGAFNRHKEVQLGKDMPFPEGSLAILKRSFVVVVGIGGVGSHAIIGLIRSGIGHIRVIDYDLVTLSSLNRHAFATRKDVGRLKARVVKDYTQTISPSTVIETVEDAFQLKDADEYILKGSPDFVIDCIDDLDAKCDLIHYCSSKSIRIVSSMGAAGKCNPSMVRYALFNEINGDVIAKRLRFQFKKKFSSAVPNIPAVLSIEKVSRGLSELEEHQKGNKDQYTINYNERVRTLPVFACLPAAFGHCLASVAINLLCGNDLFSQSQIDDMSNCLIGNVTLEKLINDHRAYESSHNHLKEEDLFLVFDDYYKIAKLFGFMSSISNKTGNKMKFIRWRVFKEPTIDNMVIMNKSELNTHYPLKSEEDLIATYGAQFVNEMDKKLSSLLVNSD